jgi:hypothetical protein
MADLRRVKARIREIAEGNRKNVTLEDIRWVVSHLELNHYTVTERRTTHEILFRVESQRFGVCGHNPGSRHIKRCYVDEFIRAMVELSLYEE